MTELPTPLTFDVPVTVLPPWPSSEATLEALLTRPGWTVDTKRVLDIGCGSGILACHLLQSGLNVVASDISFQAASAAMKNGWKNGLSIPSVAMDLVSAFANASFDLIVANLPFDPTPSSESRRDLAQALMDPHYELHGRFLLEAHRVLNYSGRIVLASSPTIGNRQLLTQVISDSRWAVEDTFSIKRSAPSERHPDREHLYEIFLLEPVV